jgi:hypothetical protein
MQRKPELGCPTRPTWHSSSLAPRWQPHGLWVANPPRHHRGHRLPRTARSRVGRLLEDEREHALALYAGNGSPVIVRVLSTPLFTRLRGRRCRCRRRWSRTHKARAWAVLPCRRRRQRGKGPRRWPHIRRQRHWTLWTGETEHHARVPGRADHPQPKRIHRKCGTAIDVGIEVDAAAQAEWILVQEAPESRVVPAGPIVIEMDIRIPPPSGEG